MLPADSAYGSGSAPSISVSFEPRACVVAKVRSHVTPDTYGPRSNITISVFSSNRRRRAAQEAPPATPPTINTRLRLFIVTNLTAAAAVR